MVYRKAKTRFKGFHAGHLRNKVSLHQVTVQPDDKTGKDYEVYNYADVWAHIKYANELLDPNGMSTDENRLVKFTIRKRSDVTSKDFIQFENQWYKIQNIQVKSQHDDFLILNCVPTISNNLRDYILVDSGGTPTGEDNSARPSTNQNWDWNF